MFPKIDDYLEILTDREVKDFVAKYFSEYFFFYIFLTTANQVEKHVQSNSSGNCMHRYNVGILNLFVK